MTVAEITERLEQFVRDRFAVAADDPQFDRDVPLFDRGYVDSIGVVELVAFVTESFGVTLPDDDLLSDDFSTLGGIARIVDRRLAAAA